MHIHNSNNNSSFGISYHIARVPPFCPGSYRHIKFNNKDINNKKPKTGPNGSTWFKQADKDHISLVSSLNYRPPNWQIQMAH